MTRARDPPGTGRSVVAARRAQQQPGIGGKRMDGALKECLYMPWEEVMCGVTPQRALG